VTRILRTILILNVATGANAALAGGTGEWMQELHREQQEIQSESNMQRERQEERADVTSAEMRQDDYNRLTSKQREKMQQEADRQTRDIMVLDELHKMNGRNYPRY